MIVGVPKEIKEDEYRVAMIPAGVEELVSRGHRVLIQTGSGLGSGLADDAYRQAGATLVETGREVFEQADLIVKVKEPQQAEFGMIRRGQALLTPMSEVAGRMSIQAGAKYLEKPQMGRGILLGGVPGVPPAHITILGGGVVGANAARIAAGFRADVNILDVNLDRMRYLDDVMPPNVNVIYSDRYNVREQLKLADLVIGSVLIPGARAPYLVRKEDLQLMKPGSVIIDVAIDQGGCIETSRPTTHRNPTYIVDEVVHYCVTNMPGAVGRTSTFALCNVTLPWVVQLAQQGIEAAIGASKPLRESLNVHLGKVTNEAVAKTFGYPYVA